MRHTGLLAALVAGLTLAASAAASAPLRIVEAGSSSYPERSYILTLPSRQSLSVDQVRITENGKRVSGLSVVSAEAAGQHQLAAVLAIDTSESMRGKPLADAMAAARAFAAHRTPEQQLAVVTFDGAVHVLQPLTTNSKAIDAALMKTPALGNGTRIYDTLQEALSLIKTANVSNGSIVLLSDGSDAGSVAKPAAVLTRLADAHVRAFTVGLDSKTFDPAALANVASATGGSFTEASTPSALKPIYDRLGGRLSNEYLVTYRSTANPGTTVSVDVSVAGFAGSASTGYQVPALHITPAPPYRPSSGDRIIESPLTMLLVALAVAAALGWCLWIILKRRSGTLLERVGSFVELSNGSSAAVTATALIRTEPESGKNRRRLNRESWAKLSAMLELADIKASASQIVSTTAITTAVIGVLLYLAIGAFGFVIALATPLVVRSLIRGKLARKRRRFAEQLPNCLEVLASSLRAGHTLIGALSVVVESAPEPAKAEFQRVIAEERLGVPLEDALQVAVVRMASRDLDQVALVARLQREVGSNSAEVLDRVVETVRSRIELRQLILTLTSQARFSRWVLSLLPVGLALALSVLNHGYMTPLFTHVAGRFFLIIALLMVISGSVVIRKLVDIKV